MTKPTMFDKVGDKKFITPPIVYFPRGFPRSCQFAHYFGKLKIGVVDKKSLRKGFCKHAHCSYPQRKRTSGGVTDIPAHTLPNTADSVIHQGGIVQGHLGVGRRFTEGRRACGNSFNTHCTHRIGMAGQACDGKRLVQ